MSRQKAFRGRVVRWSPLVARCRRCEGQSLVEFAVALVVFFSTTFGAMEFGTAVYRYNMASALAQEGARWASVRGFTALAANRATAADVSTYVTGRALGMPVTVTTTSANATTSVCTATAVDPAVLPPGTGVCVTVAVSYSPVTAFLPNGPYAMQSTAQLIMAR